MKSVINGVTTTFVGAHYQIINGTVTKYYFAGASRIAMRTGSTLTYLLGDHLGSTSLTTDAVGNFVSELRYKPWGETRYSSGTTATNYKYTGQREESSFGLYFYNARWMDPQLGRFVQADSIVPQNIQGWDRYSYTFNNPIRYIDPSGHAPSCDDWDGCSSNEDGEYVCIDGWGCFDTKHLRSFGYPGGQDAYWEDFKKLVALGEDFLIALSNPTTAGSSLTITYSVSGNLQPEQYEGVAMGIYQDFSREFEAFQLFWSNYANSDLPSDYLGLVAAMHEQTPDSILSDLGGDVIYGDEVSPGASIFPNEASNREFTPRVNVNGQYVNKPWPATLNIAPLSDPNLWAPQEYYAIYLWGAWQARVTYGSGGSFWCATCNGGR